MDLLAWLGWLVSSALGVVLSLLWFLVSGWVSTLLQIALLVVVLYFLKYGWQRAPAEIFRRTRSFGRFFVNWLRAREETPATVHERVRIVRVKEFGDINISTLLSLLMFTGLILVARL
jgi:hypothetical protein